MTSYYITTTLSPPNRLFPLTRFHILGRERVRMMTREDIAAEIKNVPDEKLDELYRIIKHLESGNDEGEEAASTMARLRQIQISAAPDFSTKATLYDVEGENAK